MALGRFSFREVQARPLRALLTFLSITIGVAAVVAVLLATATTRMAQADMLNAISGKSDLEVVDNGTRGFSYELVGQVRQVDGVAVAAPSMIRFGVVFVGEHKARTQVLGIDPRIDQQVRDYEIIEGTLPESYSEVMLDSSFAESLEVAVGEPLKILARGGLREYTVSGVVRPNGTNAVALGSAVYLVLPAAQQAFQTGNVVDQIQVQLAPGVDKRKLEKVLAELLPTGVTLRAPRTSSDMVQEAMYATENGLHMAIAFALLISMFIIYNTFQMAVGERRRQIGILRAIGATRRQVAWMILREAIWISLAGSIAGCFLGVWGAGYLNSATEQMLQVELPRVKLTWLPFVVAVLFGMGVSLLGAILPAKRASSVQPMEAMRATEIRYNDEVIRLTKPLGLIVIPLGASLLYLSTHNLLPIGGDIVAIVLMLLGCVLLIPWGMHPMSECVTRILVPFLGIEARLAQKQLMRHVGRSALTIGVLFIAISTSAGLAGNILDNVKNVRTWYEHAIIGDFFVRASMPDLASGAAADMPSDVGLSLEEIEGIQSIDQMRFVNALSGENDILLIVRSFVGEVDDFFDISEGTSTAALQGLNNNKVVIGSVLARRLELTLGDLIPIETPEGTVELEIAAITNDYFGGGLTVYMERELASRLLGVDGVDAFIIKSASGMRDQVEAELRAFCRANGLILQSYAELVTFIDGMINGVIASLWMLLGLGCIIAAMGLVNTLTMNILEQTREIGMLRVVAMTRGQVRRMIFAQATLLGLIGLIPGAAVGSIVSYLISLSSMAVLGRSIDFNFRPELVFGCLLCGLVIVMLSSLIPAERAARLKISSALHYE
ncbi:ABC transporter permease [Aureliella helgolandensis]|uniref:Macrolide export ATP-binding/permease protein MacB n=1 Tax=Aureliella helgolandensis TaxID=2527968 RepID=A0A518G648_9BACT|nr:FtsX-like permease family protein [Aureliella helgolandensis]QDV24063.1 Macrolide export ATP-binding/permease protein MacB [Aureliella helgolandensis]